MIYLNLSQIALWGLLVGLAWVGEVPWWWPVVFTLWGIPIRYLYILPWRRAAYLKELEERGKAAMGLPSEKTLKEWN